jgi:hypothetical protein
VKWAVCIITTNAAPPNTHPIRRQHPIECLQKIRRLRVVVRRRRDLYTTRHFDESSRLTWFRARLVLLDFFVGTIVNRFVCIVCPVNLRRGDQPEDVGNQISFLPLKPVLFTGLRGLLAFAP